MKILLTGANGYIGIRLLPYLLHQGHEIVCAVRDANRLSVPDSIKSKISIVEIDFLKPFQKDILPTDIQAAYYLIHSMSGSTSDFSADEAAAAERFNQYIEPTQCGQVIFLSGIANQVDLSEHLESRKNVESVLSQNSAALTVLRAAIIVGSGSASFEIIRDLCEKLPVMITPKWVNTKCQPIAIRNVIEYLEAVLGNSSCYNETFDIGGPDILTYKKMMQEYALARKLKLFIFSVPFLSPKLSSYWLYFVTSTSYNLAVNLVDSMKVEVIGIDTRIQDLIPLQLFTYRQAIDLAFAKIEQNQVASSWKDSFVSGKFNKDLKDYINIPKYGCLIDKKSMQVQDSEIVLNKIWSIGGNTGWYYGNVLWKIRGYIDKLLGGVGLRRGRTNPDKLFAGDALDFWRVLLADKEGKRLLLFAEMKVPGEAWLSFEIDANNQLHQTATFRPKGLLGRLYWYAMFPFHYFIFEGMIKEIAKNN